MLILTRTFCTGPILFLHEPDICLREVIIILFSITVQLSFTILETSLCVGRILLGPFDILKLYKIYKYKFYHKLSFGFALCR
jgi:hypothetical protein